MKILILGHGQHGKDTVAELLRDMYGFTFKSSSWAVFEQAIWPALCLQYAPLHPSAGEVEKAKQACYADRVNCRDEWKKLISDYNFPDKTKLAKMILADVDMYVGLRCEIEYAECMKQKLFNKVLWVHRPGFPMEPSMGINLDMHAMTPIINSGSLDLLRDQLREIFGLQYHPV